MNSDFSDFIRFFPIFRLFPTSRLLDSTGLFCTDMGGRVSTVRPTPGHDFGRKSDFITAQILPPCPA